MRRIATLVATGAVAAATAITLAASPASASTDAAASLSGNVSAVASGDISAQAVHNWHSYNGTSKIYGYGTYSHTSTHTTVYGYIRDSGSGSNYAGLEIRWYTAGNASYDYKILYNSKHGTTAMFPDIVDAVRRQVGAENAIFEGEALAFDDHPVVIPIRKKLTRQ